MPILHLVSIETASLLRKRRFNEHVYTYYDADGLLRILSPHEEPRNWNSPSYDRSVRHQAYSAPSLAHAQQWIREKKHFDVLVDREYFLGQVGRYYAKIIRLKDGAISETRKFRQYDKALEAGIVKALRMM